MPGAWRSSGIRGSGRRRCGREPSIRASPWPCRTTRGAAARRWPRRRYGGDGGPDQPAFSRIGSAGTYNRYAGRRGRALPVDQHELIALIAPAPGVHRERGVGDTLGRSRKASSSRGSTPRRSTSCSDLEGLYGNGTAAGRTRPCMSGRIGHHVRSGGDDITLYDWRQFVKFADKLPETITLKQTTVHEKPVSKTVPCHRVPGNFPFGVCADLRSGPFGRVAVPDGRDGFPPRISFAQVQP